MKKLVVDVQTGQLIEVEMTAAEERALVESAAQVEREIALNEEKSADKQMQKLLDRIAKLEEKLETKK
jgi:hypothetical protein